jgi:DnaK suppressor protein
MTPAQRKQLKKQLDTLLADLTKKGRRRMEPNRTSEEEAGVKEDEQPLNEMNQAIASNRNRQDAILLKRTEAALGRLDEDPDDFGNCQDCGDAIPLARLKAMPYAEFCVDCQTKHDAPRAPPTRKTLTEYSD